jgi:hypothetical protein
MAPMTSLAAQMKSYFDFYAVIYAIEISRKFLEKQNLDDAYSVSSRLLVHMNIKHHFSRSKVQGPEEEINIAPETVALAKYLQ